MRDRVEAAVAEGYQKCIAGPRMKRLSPKVQADILMHAADFFQGVLGDPAAAETFLQRVLTLVPGHLEAFNRLERRLEKLLDARRLIELYASVAAAPPKAANVLAAQVVNRVLPLPAKEPLSEDACKKLIALVPTNPRLLDALDAHCTATKRPALACTLFEQALLDAAAPEELMVARRRRVIELYMSDPASTAQAMAHVEFLLQRDPSDAIAFKAGERLLAVREVASRAAAALQTARRTRGY